MSFSDLVNAAERDVAGVVDRAEKLLPAGLPSDTREVAALAEDAAKVVVTLDPELEPIFQAIGSLGNTIQGALHEIGQHLGTLKTTLAARAAAPVSPLPPLAAPGEVPVGVPDPAAPQPAATQPQPTVNDLKAAADQAALARQAPPPAPEGQDPNPLPAADPAATAPTPDATVDPSTAATPSAPAPAPGTADPTGGNPPEPELGAAPTPAATPEQVPTSQELEQAEADFAGLSAEDKSAFEAAEGLEQVPEAVQAPAPATEQAAPPA